MAGSHDLVNMIHNYNCSSSSRDTLSQLLWVTSLMSADMQSGLAEYGLTEARAHVMWELGASERLTQRELAEALKVTPRNVTALIDALETTGFVRRTTHPTDRRAVLIVLTDKGQKTVARLQSDMARFAELLFGGMSEGELSTFRRILHEVGGRLSKLAEGKPAAARN
ncbi:MarR family transcriptional regulator [Bradyrhizobium sp. LHD-71]|uniref:MarR family winged helix-turn-helix transcriptional regulator n=1 Tax=Bradyrhizobium sp. LHD-71 TaxID=3072141 RepID=UPI00280EE251|nr:MarR family transcriptional regulator [Bradyrhizobium sp. LHD-71]MDQ8726726.1 MarR family transcriptional regulator [Bradyrhizobium sp. LHD-71]